MDFDDVSLQDLTTAAAARLAHAEQARALSDWARASVPVMSSQLTLSAAATEDRAPMTSAAHTLLLIAQQVLRTAVVADRAAGASWSAVGEALGTSKQAAHERWAESETAFLNERQAALDRPGSRNLPRALKAPGPLLAELECWFQLSPADTTTGLGRPGEPGDVADALVADGGRR